LDESNPDYFRTNQYKNYKELYSKWDKLKEDINPVTKSFDNHFGTHNLVVNGVANHTPSYHLEILLSKNKAYKTVVSIYISMFIPFYHIVLLKENLKTSKVEFDYNLPTEIGDFSRKVILEKLSFQEFPTSLLSYKIPELIVRSDFNYFNAFFTDWYRVAPPNIETL